MRPVRNFTIFAAAMAIAVATASAQPIISAKSGIIAGVEGKVLLDDKELEPSVTHFPEMKEKSILRTEAGRAEVMLPPGFMLRMGENGTLQLLTNRLIDTRLDLQKGSAVLEVDETSPDYNVVVALKAGNITVAKKGVYRLDAEPARIKVFHGEVSVQLGDQTVVVGTGKMLSLDGGVAAAEKFNVEETDALDNWSRRRAEETALASVSGAKYNGQSAPRGTKGGNWNWNVYLGMWTYIPYSGRVCNPYYGVCYYSPMEVYNTYIAQPVYTMPSGGFGGPSYTQMQGTSASTASSVSSAPAASAPAAAAATSSSSAGAATASSGHGSAAAGGHGK